MSSEPLDLAALNPYSQDAAQVLFAAFPNLKAYARVDDLEEVTPGSLLIEIPPDNPHTSDNLVITTDDDEISYYWDLWHDHLETHEIVPFLRELFAEDLAILVRLREGKWLGSSLDRRQEILIEFDEEQRTQAAGFSVYTRSWKGTYDRDATGPA